MNFRRSMEIFQADISLFKWPLPIIWKNLPLEKKGGEDLSQQKQQNVPFR